MQAFKSVKHKFCDDKNKKTNKSLFPNNITITITTLFTIKISYMARHSQQI